MSTDLKDISGSTLTPEEAEAVFELWAKRQADTETLRSRLSVQDMAEAMAISPTEVEDILAAVRAQKAAPMPVTHLAPLRKVKPVNTFLIALAVIGWLAVLGMMGYAASKSNRTAYTPQPPALYDVAPAPTAVVETVGPPFSNDLRSIAGAFSESLTVEFDGASLQGYATSGEKLLQMDTLQQIVDTIAPAPSAQTVTTLSDADIIQIFQQNGKSKLGTDVIAFKEMVLKAGNGKITKLIPVALTQEGRLMRLVREEQARRLRIFTNEAEQKLNF